MVKLSGIVITIIAAAFLGIKKYFTLRERYNILSQIKHSALQMEGKLRCMCMPLDECFTESEGLFSVAARYIEKGLIPKDAVEKACSENEYLTQADKEVLMRFAKGLGAQDCDGQIANTLLLAENIGMQIDDARNDLKTKGTLSIKGSILTAVAVVLLLI